MLILATGSLGRATWFQSFGATAPQVVAAEELQSEQALLLPAGFKS